MSDEITTATPDVSELSDGLELARVMRSAERIMRDDARRSKNVDAAEMHGDRVQMLTEFIDALVAMRSNVGVEPVALGSNDHLGAASEARSYPACKGKNCGCTDGRSHSTECRAEHDAATALPYDEKSLHHPDSGTGWKCYVCNYSGTANNFANRFCANCQCSR